MYFSFCKILEAITIYVYISILEKAMWVSYGSCKWSRENCECVLCPAKYLTILYSQVLAKCP